MVTVASALLVILLAPRIPPLWCARYARAHLVAIPLAWGMCGLRQMDYGV